MLIYEEGSYCGEYCESDDVSTLICEIGRVVGRVVADRVKQRRIK